MTWLAILVQAAATAQPESVISYPPAFFAAQRPSNAADMLARIPGFTLDYGAPLRGFESSAGNVLVDGVPPVTKNEGLGELLARIPVGKVERIEIIRGGAPGIDMQGKPVLANVVLSPDRALRAQIEGRASIVPDGRPLGEVRWEASGTTRGRTWETAGFYSKGFSGLLGPGTGIRPSTPGGPGETTRIADEDDGRLEQLTAAVEQPLAGGRLKLNGLVFHDNLKLEEDDTGDVSGAVVSTDQLTRQNIRELGAAWRGPVTARTNLEVVALHQNNGLDILSTLAAGGDRQQFRLDRSTREDIARAVVKQSWSPALSGELGAEATKNRLVSATRFSMNGAAVAVPAANVQVGEDRAEAFAKASWRMSFSWSLDGQLRYERSTITASGDVGLAKTLAFVKPRLLATWSRGSSQVRLRLEREVGQLAFDAFVAQGSLSSATGVTAGNPDLEPERASTAEVAVEQRFWGRGAFVVTASHSRVQGVVDRGPVFTPAGNFDRPANIGDGRRDALKADLTLPLDRLGLTGAQVKAAAVRRWSRVDDPTTGLPRPISGLKPLEWEVHFTQDRPVQNLTWGVDIYSGWRQPYWRFNALDLYKLDPFVMSFVEWRPKQDVSIRAELENITKRGYRHTTLSFAGVRDAAQAGPATLTDQNYNFGRILFVRVRKSFGG